jgi:hypothetical protein
MEILKGYYAKVRGQQKWRDAGLQDELFALFKLAWLENARLLARREGQNYYFLASFLGEEEAARFTENFAFRKPTVPWLRPFEAGNERGYAMVKKVVRRVSSSEEWRHMLRLALDLGHSQFATSTKTVQPD